MYVYVCVYTVAGPTNAAETVIYPVRHGNDAAMAAQSWPICVDAADGWKQLTDWKTLEINNRHAGRLGLYCDWTKEMDA